ncbi:MAG: hypothetical protein ACE5IW_11080 [bacterium]
MDATGYFTFCGEEAVEATVIIRDKALDVQDGHLGTADIHLKADSRTWLGFLAAERSLAWALLSRKIRIKGSPSLLIAVGKGSTFTETR